MPADFNDGTDDNSGDVQARDFDAVWWSPADREYGILNLLVCRTAMEEILAQPSQGERLKSMDSRLCCPVAPSHRGTSSEEDDDDVSEGEPYEETEPVSWPGKPGSWWRVNGSLGEDVIVRQGVSLVSPELRRVAPGELVQQAGLARAFADGRACGCVRLPVRPSGWVTADATKAGGPKYLMRAGIPRWRVVYYPANDNEKGDVIVRTDPALGSDEVSVLHYGDIVEQAGPSTVRPDGIVRMPITAAIIRRSEMSENGDPPHDANHTRLSLKTLGWVTVDATAAGGPSFFKPAADADGAKRRRRPKA
mmetsp:Transcript_56961/g.114312  ORF Transcript_56961/g.114312 Transcript_56961/m.114312 type:complete len:307 (-) Transcript_56961:171-1091(-)